MYLVSRRKIVNTVNVKITLTIILENYRPVNLINIGDLLTIRKTN